MNQGRKIKLTDWANCAGCAAKLGQSALMQVLRQLPAAIDPDLLVGIDTADDAGVFKISDELAVISTLDFFPPIVDDPFTFGQIAAANALSDVYAMGGAPRLAMNIVCFPKALPLDVLDLILKGAMEKIKESGALLVGGHSVEDNEVKYGLSVTGFAHPSKITANSSARPGDMLVLTKPVGVGVVMSALKAGRIRPEDAEPAVASMTALNRAASEAMQETGVNACTDVTGYGVLGHAMEMAKGSGVNIEIRAGDVALLPGARELMRKRANRPRTLASNMEFVMKDAVADGIPEDLLMCLFDPQTSGGLLISVPEAASGTLLSRLRARSISPRVIGRVLEKEDGWRIRVA